ncbi:AAA family ATPase [Chryseobacterium sp. JM1]|uniref:AAA family ATPase n=1 Tax=Chryseobacterium sp. JM1 TaxID=1233950 RepID=UPI0004E70290|nr:AAA family ATPase [Chryseobacterium sp. JM1]KFF19233.1 hypothetical protein IW22_16325 [Chryseobacterium sp. JM1]
MKSTESILLNEFEEYYLNENDRITPLVYLPYTNRINIFIGANNSGKSKFMRKLMSAKNFKILNEGVLNTYNLVITKYNGGRSKLRVSELTKRNDLENQIRILNNSGVDFDLARHGKLITVRENIKPCYIPVLRTAHSLFQQFEARNFKKIEDDILQHTLRKNYNLSSDIDVFTGVHLYNEILDARNSKKETRSRFETFEKFISQYFFDGKAIEIIAEFNKGANRKGDNTNEIISIHIEGEKHSRDLYHLGDGIQALILLMYKIFMADENTYIFIDEPEINLHPGMQRLFLEQITSNSYLTDKNLTYFISTHSNHFLDLTLEEDNISIYSFYANVDRDGDKMLIIKNANTGDNSILKNIGVNNSSVFMANCSVWVEGISDRLYIRAFLKAYCDFINESFPKEDIDFAFFEYAGSNLDHYFFDNDIEEGEEDEIIADIKAMSLSNRIFLLADSDNVEEDSAKGRRLAKIESVRSENFIPKIIRAYREVENLLPNEVWDEILIELCNKKLVAGNKDDIEEKIKEALQEINSDNYKDKYIGEFLNDMREKMGVISEKHILNKSEYKTKEDGTWGTLVNKRALSEAFAKKEFSWDILKKSQMIEELTVEIYSFIKRKKAI